MASPEGFSTPTLMNLLGHITEAAVHPEHWPAFLEALEDEFPGTRMMLLGHENGRPTSALSFCRNFPEEDLRDYSEHYVRSSPYVLRGLERLQIGQARFSEAVTSNQDLAKTEYYNDFILKRGLGCYAAGVIIERSPQRSVALSLSDHRDEPDRRERQLRLLDALTPHIARAFRLHTFLDRERQRAKAAEGAFEAWAHAALVLSPDGRVLTMNSAARLLLAARDGVTLARDGRLRSVAEGANAALDNAIFACAAGFPPESGGLALPRFGGSALNVMVSPLPLGSDMGGASGAVLVILTDPDAAPRTPIGWIVSRFGLAPAEARLAKLLIQGDTLADAADELGITLSTARTRLKAIQAKTGRHRQADLIRLALSMPPMRN